LRAVAEAIADQELQSAEWDLAPLLDGGDESSIDPALDDAERRAKAFAERYQGKLAELDGPGLVAAMRELAEITEIVGRCGNYAMLRFTTDTTDPARGALMQAVQERATGIETTLLFFELEWAALDDDKADELLEADGLDFARHHLRMARRYRPHLLTEPEERILTEKALTGRSAWGRLFEELTSAITVDLPPEAHDPSVGGGGDDGSVPLDVALSRLHAPQREVRKAAATAITEALAPGLRTRAFVFNTLLHDKAVDDRLRNYPTWISSRNLANEVSDESVEALVAAVQRRYDLPQRWYRLKAQMLGLDKLADYDRMAAVTSDDESIDWREAKRMVHDAYGSFSGELADLVTRFYEENWIDAPLRPGKRGGAFSAATVPSVHPYVMLNFTATRRDVLTLAHELGHGVHQALAAKQGVFHQNTPLTMAETASVFGENVTFGRLLERAETPESRLSLLASNLEDTIATVFRQIAMNRFEDAVHTERRNAGELSVDRFNELWAKTQTDLLGDSVDVTEGYRSWWSYVPHFISVPGYVYAYAFGQLLAMSIYRRYIEEGESFVPAYLELLAAGGSKPPEELAKIVGVDLADPSFWDDGLALVEEELQAAEQAAVEAGRLPSSN
jgi:oligoendopeptidase F